MAKVCDRVLWISSVQHSTGYSDNLKLSVMQNPLMYIGTVPSLIQW